MPFSIPARRVSAGLVSLAALGAAAGIVASATAAINSNLYIEPAETFVLGGSQPGDFTVKGQNRGEVTVEVFAATGETRSFVTAIEPGAKFEAGFDEGQSALLRNTSDTEQAYLKLRITGTTKNLGMSYEANEALD